ncbi:MAG: nuclear transport factor 2 family protein [Candidatus Atribacteria bacterium]|nr:nuclear transport factor 2 family protein [Candidatus Atribacteria bacterium]
MLTAFADSLNAGDLDATMALFTDDATVKFFYGNVLPSESYIGSEQIRTVMKDLIAMHFKIQIEILQVLGDIAVTRSKAWADETIQLGVAPLEMIEVYSIRDGKLKGLVSIVTDESLAKIQDALAPK